jgi:homoserine kinase
VRITVRVPATSANLGPGFDCFGLALDLCNEVTVDTEAEPSVTWEGEGADELPTDGTDMISRAMEATLERYPADGRGAMPPFSLHGANRIPLERGLGSSSAAAVAGAAIAQAWSGRSGPVVEQPVLGAVLLSVASELEGHPDNAAAVVHGGFTIVTRGVARRLDPHPSLVPVVFVPEERLATNRAREVLPSSVSRDDAVFNVGRAAFAVVALTQDPSLLPVAMDDRLHEDARASLMPDSANVLSELRRSQLPACLSGAGPSVLAFERNRHPMPEPPAGWRVLRPGVRRTGVEIEVED